MVYPNQKIKDLSGGELQVSVRLYFDNTSGLDYRIYIRDQRPKYIAKLFVGEISSIFVEGDKDIELPIEKYI